MNNKSSNNQITNGRDKKSMYDVRTYTDEELFNILDLDAPTDRELEAKIIFLIKKYRNMQNASGDELAEFFENIYRHFFETEEEEDDDEDGEEEREGFQTIKEGLSNEEIIKTTTPEAKEVSNVQKAVLENKPLDKTTAENIGYTKSLEYANDKLNPLLQQTIKRVISIDSQYRDDKKTLSTEFTFNLSDPLKDVVSLKLYSVQIPYTWYTINNNFGSNFFVFKGNAIGIDNGNHDYQIDISAGNYSPQELTNTINNSITSMSKQSTDISFGNTSLIYNSNTSLIKMNIDLYKQYNETSYYLNFPNSIPFNEWTLDTSSSFTNRRQTIPSFLGLIDSSYTFFKLESEKTLPLSTDTANENLRYILDTNNNHFVIYKYIGDEYADNQLGRNIDLSINVVLSLLPGGNYTRAQIYTDLNNVIKSNNYLTTTESGIQRIDVSGSGYSYFKLKLKPNRNTTNNLSYSKLQIQFPQETTSSHIWTGVNSCFQFAETPLNINEMNNIISEESPLQQSNTQYIIQSSPYIYLYCNSPGYNLSQNNYKILLPNTNIPYKLTSYIDAINAGFSIADNSINITKDNTYVQIDNQGIFNAQFDLTSNISTSNYRLDLSGSFLRDEFGFDASYNLNANGGIYTSTFTYKENYTIPQTGIFAKFSARIPGIYIDSDLSYTLYHPSNTNGATTPFLSDNGQRLLENTINQQFSIYKDADGVQVLNGTNVKFQVAQNIVTATLTVVVNKQLTEANYDIQFLEDISYNITQTNCTLDTAGGVAGVTDAYNYITYVDGSYDLSDTQILSGLGVLSDTFNLIGTDGTYNLTTSNILTSQFDTTTIPLYNGQYRIDTSYVAFISVKKEDTYNREYGRSALYGSTTPYNYLIPTPFLRTYNNLFGLVAAINAQFNLFPDLSGTVLEITNTSGTQYDCRLTVVIKQNYKYDSWYRNLNVSRTMIDSGYRLASDLSYSIQTANEYGSIALGIKGTDTILSTTFQCNNTNNTFELIPYDEGVVAPLNKLIFTLPLTDVDGITINYTRSTLIDQMNNLFIGTIVQGSTISIIIDDTGVERTKLRITINKEYTSKDYRIVFYDPYSFVKCFSGVNSVRNVTWDTTLGWILGFRLSTIYYLSDYTTARTATLIADTGISTNLFNYFLITLDDYNQNHLNDGLVTITTKDTEIPLPSYANRMNYICDPVTKELTYNTNQRTDYSRLTQNQMYAMSQIVNSKNAANQITEGEVSTKNYGTGPFAKDVFGMIPMKLSGLKNGDTFVEYGGTLQNQERIYFGPVNIHRMTVKLLGDRGNVVDLNGANWSFSLICEQLYKPQINGKK